MSLDNRVVAILVLVFGFTCVLGKGIKIHFPPSSLTVFPRLRLQSPLPNLREFTFCAWVRPSDLSRNHSTILSYATQRSHNELLLMLVNHTNKVGFRMYRGDVSRDFNSNSSWEEGEWRHICVTWFGRNGIVKIYFNGMLCSVNNLGKPSIPGDGFLVLGQDQDELDSKFDSNQAWHGDMTEVHLWNEVIPANRIQDLARCEETAKGSIINWLETEMTIFDGVIMSRTEQC